MKIGLSLTAFTQGAGGISITINGLTGGNAVVGDHASITMTASSGTITARKWGSTPGGSEYGTSTSPTDFTAGEGGALYATATVGGSDYSSSASIVFAAPVASGGIADQSYAQGSAISTLDVSSDFTGSGITYALAPSSASLPAGLSLASNGQITGTPTAEAAQVNIVVRGTNSGGFADTAFGVTITAAVVGDTEVTTGSVTFSWTNGRTSGTDASGRPYVVVPSGSETFNQPTPAQTTDGGDVVNGVMKTPLAVSDAAVDQGFDARQTTTTYDALLNVTGTTSMTAGDRLVKAISGNIGGYSDDRAPLIEEYQVCHVVSSALGANDILGPAVTYSGHSYPDKYTVDWSALVALFQNRSASGISLTVPPYATAMATLNKEAPMFAYNISSNGATGYEPLFPEGFTQFNASAIQYGRYIAWAMNTIAIGLHYDTWSTAEKTAILKRMVRHGIDWGFPLIDSGVGLGPNGGHNQFHQFCTLLALIACGRTSDIPTFLADVGGNWEQAFEVTNALIASDFSQHTSATKSHMFRERTLSTQPGGNVVRIPAVTGVTANQNYIPVGAQVMRKGAFGGVPVATVTTETAVSALGTVDIPIDAQPDVAFTSGDVIWFEAPPATLYDGAFDWNERDPSVSFKFSPSKTNAYRDLQASSPAILATAAIGYLHDSLRAQLEYSLRSEESNIPKSDNDYPTSRGTWLPGGVSYNHDAIYSTSGEVAALAYGTASVYESSAPTDITLQHVAHPSATVGSTLADGLVIGVVGDLTKQAVKVAGIATGGDKTPVQVKVTKDGDSSVVLDWTHLGWIDSGTFEGTIELPIGDDWYNFEVRSLRNTAVTHPTTNKIGVGYKIMIIGQSQVSIWGDDNAATSLTMTAAYENTGSFYKWQADNGVNPAVSESLSLVDDTGPDGPRAFIEQARALGVTAPIMLVREAVNGTGIVDMLDDGATGRNISDLTDKVNKYGKDFSAVIEWWDTNNQSALNGDTDIEILFGINAHSTAVDHGLNEYLLPGYKVVIQPASRHSTGNNDGGHAVQKVDYLIGTPKLQATVGWPLADYQTTASTGGPHPLSTGDGNIFAGYRMALGFVESIGGTSFDKPYLTGTAERSSDGTQITIPITMANGGTLGTEGSEVSGFYVSEDSGTNYYSRNSKHENGTAPDGSFGFQATVSGSNVILTKDGGGTWAAAANLRVQKRYHLEHYEGDADEQIVVDGEIYETGVTNIKGPGLPVHGNTSGGVWDLGNNANMQAWQITTVTQAAAAPTISSSDPADNATDHPIGDSITITFDQNVAFGTGNIVLRTNNAGWSDAETFSVTTDVGAADGQVSISGAVLTINPTGDLTASREYAIRIDATAIDSTPGGLSFAGIADDTTLSFTTASSFTATGLDNAGNQRATDYGMTATGYGSEVTLSGWVYLDAMPASGQKSTMFALYNGGSPSVRVEVWDTGVVAVFGQSGSGVTLFDVRSPTSQMTTGQWYHVFVSAKVDQTTPVVEVFIDQTEITYSFSNIPSSGPYTLRTPNRMMLFQHSGPAQWMDGALSEIYVDNVYRATPAAFHSGGSPIDLSAVGSPYYYLTGATQAAFIANTDGSEDGLTVEDGATASAGTLTPVTGPT